MGDIRLLDMENDTQETIPEIKPMKMPWMSDSTWSPQDGVEYLSAGSVSYTHLDVYKRQVWRS